MISGLLLFHIVAIPLVFYIGRLSNRIAFVRVKAENRTSITDFVRERDSF